MGGEDIEGRENGYGVFPWLFQFPIGIEDQRLAGLKLENLKEVGGCRSRGIEAVEIESGQFCHYFKSYEGGPVCGFPGMRRYMG